MLASDQGDLQIVKYLIEAGADLEAAEYIETAHYEIDVRPPRKHPEKRLYY